MTLQLICYQLHNQETHEFTTLAGQFAAVDCDFGAYTKWLQHRLRQGLAQTLDVAVFELIRPYQIRCRRSFVEPSR